MQITINGEPKSFDQSVTVADVLREMEIEGRVAVEINREILPRSRFEQHQINSGDVVEIVHAIGGG
ncbi:MAG: sulfur carrier protein ThiS [Gammaproteobacteria bacterium]